MEEILMTFNDACKIILKGTKRAIPTQQYTGNPIKPTIDLLFKSGKSTATGTNLKLRKGTDYEVCYFDNTEVGTATVFVKALTAAGKLFSSITVTFKIDRKES